MADSQTPDPTKTQLQIEFSTIVDMPRTATSAREKFVEGAVLPLFGLRFALARKEYRRMVMTPVLLQTVISISLLTVFTLLVWLLKSWLQSGIASLAAYFRPQSDAQAIGEWSSVILLIVCGFACWYLFLVVWRISGGLLDDYFGDRITDTVMNNLGIVQFAQPASVSGTFLSGYRDAVLVHAGIAICSPLSLIPVVGVFAAAFGGALVGGFIHGTSQLVTPLQAMGKPRQEAIRICFRQRWTVVGMAASRDIVGPIPLFGGLINAGEAVGRILLAARLLKLDEPESDHR